MISICILNWNCLITLEKIIKVIREDLQSIAYEIIIYDQNSNDGSVDYLKKIESNNIQVILDEHNSGNSIARNRMINQSKYKYILLLDSDLSLFYNSFKYIIQKIDFVRLLILYHFGGVYIDIDSLCFGSVDDILKYPVSVINTKKHPAFSDFYPFILNNAFISSEKNNHFIKTIINNIIEYKDPNNYYDFCSFNPEYTTVLRSAGPLCITESYMRYEYKNLINLLENKYYYGLEKPKNCDLQQIISLANETIKNIDGCKLLHIHESSWWKKDGSAVSPPRNDQLVYLNDQDKNSIKNTWYN